MMAQHRELAGAVEGLVQTVDTTLVEVCVVMCVYVCYGCWMNCCSECRPVLSVGLFISFLLHHSRLVRELAG